MIGISDIEAMDLAARDRMRTDSVLIAEWSSSRWLFGTTIPLTVIRLHSPGATFSLVGETMYRYRGDRHGD